MFFKKTLSFRGTYKIYKDEIVCKRVLQNKIADRTEQ